MKERPNRNAGRTRTLRLIAVLLFALCTAGSVGAAPNKVSVFGVDLFVGSGQCTSSNIQGAQSALGFKNNITSGGPLTWVAGLTRTNQQVSGFDLSDPTWSGNGSNRDQSSTKGLDVFGTGISYLAAHGAGAGGNAFDETQPCTSASQCNNPQGITHMPSHCAQDPRSPGTASCLYEYAHAVVVCGTGDSNSTDRVDYSYGSTNPTTPKEMRVGESSNSGSWGQAGTDGGINLLVMEASHSTHLGSGVNDLYGLFAGIQVLATSFTHYGDLASGAERGTDFGALAKTSPSMAVSDAWVAVTGMLTLGSGCGSYPGYSDGGFNGCGGHVAMVVDSTAAGRDAEMNFTFYNLQSDSNDSTGNAYWATLKTYNWDSSSVPGLL